MGERYSVSLLKELPDLNSVWCSINISPLRGCFLDRLLRGAGRNQFHFRYPGVNAWAREIVRMTLIKICGITNLEDARAATEAGADMLGFNFYGPSPRFIEPSHAREIIEELQSELEYSPQAPIMVAVFVNESSPEALVRIAGESGVYAVQLHGDESAEYCQTVKRIWRDGLLIIKALRVDPTFDPQQVGTYEADAIMLDSFHSQLWGGTGQVIDWSVARRAREIFPCLFLAGGLSPENVAKAIAEVQPFAVDACSSLESLPGRKDPERMKAFVRAVRSS